MAQLKVMSALLSRLGLGIRAGLQFGGKRDLYSVFGYKNHLQYVDFLAKYVRQDIAARIIDAPVAAVWRFPPEISQNDELKEKWEPLVRKHKIWNNLERVDKLSSIGQFAVLLLGFDDGSNLELPVNSRSGSKLLYLQPYSEISTSIIEFDQDPTSPRYALPKKYEIDTVDPSKDSITGIITPPSQRGISTTKLRVHYSRILHVADTGLEDNVYGIPRLSKIYNLLDDLLKVSGGASETFWLVANRGLQANVDKDMDLDPADAKALSDELEEYQHQLRRVIRTRGVEVKSIGSDNPDPKGTFDMIISLLSGATGIPKRLLTGSEVGQLASQQDRANWSDRVAERRSNFAEPLVLRPLFEMLSNAGILPETEDLELKWPEAFRMNPLEEAQKSAQTARAVVNLSKQGTPSQVATVEESRVIVGLPEKPEMGTLEQPVIPDPSAGGPGGDDDDKDDIDEIPSQPVKDDEDE